MHKSNWKHFLGWVRHVYALVLFLAIGFLLTAYGPISWDEPMRYLQSRSVLDTLGLVTNSRPLPDPIAKYYGQLWELILGIGSEIVFPWLGDPHWVRHALNVTLYLTGLYTLFHLLRRSEYSRGTAFLVIAGIFSIIRLGGHSLFNSKDMPGAIVYLLCGVTGWLLMKEGQKKNFPVTTLILLGITAAMPFVVRSPLITYLPLFVIVLFLASSTMTRKKRLMTVFVPIAACSIFIVALSPALWTLNPHEWLTQFGLFGRFSHGAPTTRAFGITWPSDNVPLWYPLIWIPVMITPLGLALAGIGSLFFFFEKVSTGEGIKISVGKNVVSMNLSLWMWIVTITSFVSVMAARPNLYDEDRHLMFLYVVLFTSCFLCLSALSERVKVALAALLIVLAAHSYLRWGWYSYIYRSPVILNATSRDFMGDYWGICVNEGIRSLKGRVTPGSILQTSIAVAPAMIDRLQTSILFQDASYGSFPLRQLPAPKPKEYFSLVFNREHADGRIIELIDQRNAWPVWQNTLPNGEPACRLVYIPNKDS